MSGTPELTAVHRALIEIRRLRAEVAELRAAAAAPEEGGAVALVGMALRVPGEPATLDDFWAQLARGHDAIGPLPDDRWDHHAVFDPDPESPGTTYVNEGGFVERVYDFDPEFFGIAAREARAMDPQQRIVLETAWRALDHAGIDPRSLSGSATGVFLGIANGDYGRVLYRDLERIDEWSGQGAAYSVASGRLAYLLGLRGPALSIDTACSSSLVAAHLAVRSLRDGECDLAIIGGVNLILAPEVMVNFSRARMLSPTGRCHTFDAAADGYVRSEGCGVVVARRLDDALRRGDRILAVLRGSAVNQDGRSAGLTAPSAPAQEEVIRTALADAGLGPDAIDAIEAHGTGTSLGDPIELEAIGRVFRTPTRKRPLLVGSVKTNMGHLEAAAGVAGLARAVLAVRHGVVPPHPHFREPNPHVEWDSLPVEVPTEAVSLPGEGPHRIGVSSFGFSGTNAHLIVESAPPVTAPAAVPHDPPFLLPLSARDPESLEELARDVVEAIEASTAPFGAFAATAGRRRTAWPERLAVIAGDAAEAAAVLRAWLDGAGAPDEGERLVRGRVGGVEETAGGSAPPTDRSSLVRWAAHRWATGTPLPAEVRDRVWPALPPVDFPSHPWRRRTLRIDAPPPTSWRARVVTASRNRHARPPAGVDLAAYDEIAAVLGELAEGTGRWVLARTGLVDEVGARLTLDELMETAGVRPLYRPIVRRWLAGLVAAGVLEAEGEGASYRVATPLEAPDLDALRERARAALADDDALREYVDHAAALAPAIYTGEVAALESLFPDGSFDLAVRLYSSAGPLRHLNQVAAEAVRSFVAERGPGVRVLEVGAGTGGSTGAIIEAVGPAATWLYTDVSPVFLDHGAERFGHHPGVRTALFDLDREPDEQAIGHERFDLVVASNSLHAVRDLPAALDRVRRLLAPGGMAVLIETTAHLAWHDVTTGLIEGWQGADDDLRGEGPLLDASRWTEALHAAGFDEVAAVPAAEEGHGPLALQLLLAFVPEGAPEDRRSASLPAPAAAEGTVGARPPADRAQGGAAGGAPDPADPTDSAEAGEADGLSRLLEGAVGRERERRVVEAVRDVVMDVLHADPDRPPSPDARLMELGVDSLLAVRLRNRLRSGLGLSFELPSTLIFEYPSIHAIAGLLLERAGEGSPSAPRPADREPAASGDDAPVEGGSEGILELSDAEVEALLLEQLDLEEQP